MEQAAAIPCSGFTAYQAIVNKLKIITSQPDATILIHGGAGGVGGYAIQLAKAKELRVISTCSENHKEYVRNLGADVVIDYRNENVFESVMKETNGRGVDYIVNTIDADSATRDIDMLAFGGELVAIVEHPHFERLKFYEKALSIHEVALGGAHLNGDWKSQLQLAEIGRAFLELMEKGIIQPLDLTIISLEEIPEYLGKLKGRHLAGKIVAKI
jgi:NADPH:quinone reductase-like Zn-dependent oxidoreductase